MYLLITTKEICGSTKPYSIAILKISNTVEFLYNRSDTYRDHIFLPLFAVIKIEVFLFQRLKKYW